MNNKILIAFIPFIIANAQASGDCTNEKRKINDQNTYILMGVTPFGPVKSIQSTVTNEINKKKSGNTSAEFSDCGELTSFEYSSNSGGNPDTYGSYEKTKLIKDDPLQTQSVYIYNYPPTYINSITDTSYYLDKKGKIIKQKIQSSGKEQNQLQSNEVINTSTSAEGTYNWKYGSLDNMTTKSSDNQTATIQYQWNDNGKISNTIVKDIDDSPDIWLTKMSYLYTTEQFIEKKIYDFYKNDKVISSTIVECLENDSYGNCIIETTAVAQPNSKPSLISTTKYNYQYH